MVQFIQPESKDVNGMVTALNNLRPGQEVAYGLYGAGLVFCTESDADRHIVQKTISRLEAADKIMLFHRRVGRDFHLVARGVLPETKRKIEEFALKFPTPVVEKKHRLV